MAAVIRNPKIEFDMLKMYFGRPYVIDLEDTVGSITIYTPSLGKIVDMGETRFFRNLNIFITNTTQYRLQLWESGVDWCEISDFDLFMVLYKGLDPEANALLFGEGLDFSRFQQMRKCVPIPPKEEESPEGENKEEESSEKNADAETEEEQPEEPKERWETVLYDEEDGIEINYNVYNHMCQYLRTLFGINPEEKITSSKALKEMYIQKDKYEQKNAEWKASKGKIEESASMQAVISACVNHPGFKYRLDELEDVSVAFFYDAVKRLQIYEQTTAALKGIYSGMIDGSSFKQEDLNFMKSFK